MIKRDITYVDFEGVERTDTFYFNLSQYELMDLDVNYSGGLIKTLETLKEEQKPEKMWNMFVTLVNKSVGRKSADGKKFEKSKEILEDLTFSNAYSVLIRTLIENSDYAAAFVNGIMPADEAPKETPATIAAKS